MAESSSNLVRENVVRDAATGNKYNRLLNILFFEVKLEDVYFETLRRGFHSRK